MYCKRGFDCLLVKAKSTRASSHDLKKKFQIVSRCLETLSSSGNRVLNKNSSYQRLQSGITFSSLCQSRNIQTTELYFSTKSKDTFERHPVSSDSSSSESPVSYENLASKLQQCSSVQEQMEELGRMLCLTAEDVKRREQLCFHIQEILSPFFKNSTLQMYGSSANGFGFKGCDIDMSFHTMGNNRKLVLSHSADIDVPSVHDVINGQVSVESIAELPQREQLLFIHEVLHEYYRESAEPVIYINAYIPIVRFHHDKYKLKCDLSLNNNFAFINTKLLKLCGLLDERVSQLMVTIRYWAKHVELIAGGLSFNTYTITLIVLYFLQTRKPPVLPSVEHLLASSEYLKNDDMKDDSYLQDIKKLLPSENRQTAVELLREFFFFCAYFDYGQVMCPLTASCSPKAEIFSRHKNFKLNTICIQDPIKLTHNVATLVSYKSCRKFLMESLMAVKLSHEDNLWSPSSAKWGILSLFERPENCPAALCNSDYFLCFQIPHFASSTEIEGREVSYHSSNDTKQTWFPKISQVVLNVLEYGLLFECKVRENVERHRHSHFEFSESLIPEENQSFIRDNQILHVLKMSDSAVTSSILLKDFVRQREPNLIINCVAHENTWIGREDLRMKACFSDSICDPLEMEHAISLKLVDQRKKDDRKELFSFVCECYELDLEKQKSLFIKFEPCEQTNFNPILGLFLKAYVPKTVSAIIKSTKTQLAKQHDVLNSL